MEQAVNNESYGAFVISGGTGFYVLDCRSAIAFDGIFAIPITGGIKPLVFVLGDPVAD
jgi:hypothetical protein